MAIVRCRNSHHYDSSLFTSCPHCAAQQTIEETVSFVDGGYAKNAQYSVGGYDATVATYDDERTVRLGGNNHDKTVSIGSDDFELTTSIFSSSMSFKPVVGWLICTDGPGRGRDYRLHAERNFIGRGHKMDVCIVEDIAIARENHASIIYDPKGNEFIILGGTGICTQLNGQTVNDAQRLMEGDTIKLGGSTFDFVAYCNGGKRWQ